MKSLLIPIAIIIGATIGAISRFYLTEWTKRVWGDRFAYGTFIVNITGCLLIGLFFTLSTSIKGYSTELDILIRTGFLGSFTTFSTYSWETFILWHDHKVLSLFYSLASAIFGIAAVYLGILLGRLFIN